MSSPDDTPPATSPTGFSFRDFPLARRLPTGLRKSAKALLARLPASHTLRLLAAWPNLRVWRNTHLNPATPVHEDRYALYQALVDAHLPPAFAYLEFGCAAGEVVDRWAAMVPHPDARFYGFDTFTGMPEAWSGLGWHVEQGAWTQGGTPPETDDPRIAYVKGKFQDTLEGFLDETQLFGKHEHFVIHIDADLYSATLYVLVMMRPVLNRATVLFDEFDCVLDEMQALEDFCRAFGLTYEVLGTATSCEKVAIRFLPKAD